ncbi:hypothetical protein CS0771_20270 [Catellatospora sp. IY07-71]|nr:hypothetical protein [Catellatospora sp. IY07-71]BCJ72483.1 hypothetical protein CS0771_20270 [Catellatospora sp. IY07-71]
MPTHSDAIRPPGRWRRLFAGACGVVTLSTLAVGLAGAPAQGATCTVS